MPFEIKLKIAGIIKSQASKARKIRSLADFEGLPVVRGTADYSLSQMSLLSRSWYKAGIQEIWTNVIATTDNLPFLIKAILSSAVYDMKRENNPENIGLVAEVEIHLQELEMEMQNSLKRTKNMTIDTAATSILTASESHFVTSDGDEEPPLQNEFQDINEALLQTMIEHSIEDIGNRISDSKMEFDRRLKRAIVKAAEVMVTRPMVASYGVGKLIKSIHVPSYDPLIHHFRNVFPFLPNLKVLKYKHPAHGHDFIPTLHPALVKASRKHYTLLDTITADDIGEESWPLLIEGLANYGSNIRVLNLEACNEKDPYGSKRGMATVFPHLKKLECIRLDGLPLGSNDFSWGGDLDIMIMGSLCTNLRVVSLDFCDITLESFYTLWNRCPNLEFLGFAGLHGHTSDITLAEKMEIKLKLTTLRFVDCRVTDDMIVKVAKHAPNLQLFRCVYEYPSSFQNWNPNHSLTDAVLHAFANHCPKLSTLAISKTSAMTSGGFISLLENCKINLLDFHNTDWDAQGGVIGVLDDSFVMEIIPYLKNVPILNFFDQPSLDEKVLIKLITSCTNLQSLCLNNTNITVAFLKKIIEIPALRLKRLSLFGCTSLSFDEIGWFCESLESSGKSLDTLYVTPQLPDKQPPLSAHDDNIEDSDDTESPPFVKDMPPQESSPLPWSFKFATFEDTWFMDEKLDIFSLFEAAVNKPLE